MHRNWLGALVVLFACGGQDTGSITVVSRDTDWPAAPPSLAISSTGQLAIAWTHMAQVARVAMLHGSEWKQLGNDVVATSGYHDPIPQIAFQPDGTLLLKTEDQMPGSDYDAIVMVRRWTGSAWDVLGEPGGPLDGQAISSARMAIDSTGAPVIAAGFIAPGSGGTAVSVRRWDGAAWAPVGSDPLVYAPMGARFYGFSLDASDQPVVLLVKLNVEAGLLGIVRWDGAAWQEVPEVPADIVGYQLTMDSSGALLVATRSQDVTLKRFDGMAWSASPPTKAIDGPSTIESDLPVAVESAGGILVGWQEGASSGWAARWGNYVRRWTGEAWQPVLGPFDSGNGGSFIHMQMALGGPYDSEPVVAWMEYGEPFPGISRDGLYVRVP